jgi:hypothetical protein
MRQRALVELREWILNLRPYKLPQFNILEVLNPLQTEEVIQLQLRASQNMKRTLCYTTGAIKTSRLWIPHQD